MQQWKARASGIGHALYPPTPGGEVLTVTVDLAHALGGSEPPCAVEPERWFPDRGQDDREALSLCQRCPGRRQCDDLADALRVREGIWGGYLRRSGKKAPPPGERSPRRKREPEWPELETYGWND